MARPRPVATHYMGGPISHSASPENAVANAIGRILTGQYRAADIYLNERCIASIAYSTRYDLTIKLRNNNVRSEYTRDRIATQSKELGAVVHH